MIEHWLIIEEFPDYLVSNLGRVYSELSAKVICQYLSNSGYFQVQLSENGKTHHRYVHRLVADAFYEMDIDGFQIDHVDNDRQNNCIWNLEIVTRNENLKRAYDRGQRLPVGMKPVQIIETGDRFDSLSECASFLGRTYQAVSFGIRKGSPVSGYHIEHIESEVV